MFTSRDSHELLMAFLRFQCLSMSASPILEPPTDPPREVFDGLGLDFHEVSNGPCLDVWEVWEVYPAPF